MKKFLGYCVMVLISIIVYALFQSTIDSILDMLGAIVIVAFVILGIAGLLLKGVREIFG